MENLKKNPVLLHKKRHTQSVNDNRSKEGITTLYISFIALTSFGTNDVQSDNIKCPFFLRFTTTTKNQESMVSFKPSLFIENIRGLLAFRSSRSLSAFWEHVIKTLVIVSSIIVVKWWVGLTSALVNNDEDRN